MLPIVASATEATVSQTSTNPSGCRKYPVVITGGNSGIGYQAALLLAARHANVVIACPSLDRARAAASSIADAHPGAAVEVMELDLASVSFDRAVTWSLK